MVSLIGNGNAGGYAGGNANWNAGRNAGGNIDGNVDENAVRRLNSRHVTRTKTVRVWRGFALRHSTRGRVVATSSSAFGSESRQPRGVIGYNHSTCK